MSTTIVDNTSTAHPVVENSVLPMSLSPTRMLNLEVTDDSILRNYDEKQSSNLPMTKRELDFIKLNSNTKT
jgi:hypothetical protein